MYQIDDYVMHRSNGLCRVIGTGYPEFGGEKGENLCYILESQRNKGRMYTPVESGESILRPVMSYAQAEELVGHLQGIELIAEENDKLREAAYRRALHEEGYIGWVRIIKTAYAKRVARMKAGKKSTIVDRRFEKQAVEDYLVERVEGKLSAERGIFSENIV